MARSGTTARVSPLRVTGAHDEHHEDNRNRGRETGGMGGAFESSPPAAGRPATPHRTARAIRLARMTTSRWRSSPRPMRARGLPACTRRSPEGSGRRLRRSRRAAERKLLQRRRGRSDSPSTRINGSLRCARSRRRTASAARSARSARTRARSTAISCPSSVICRSGNWTSSASAR